ncbi:MAG: hypothetical protein H7319_05790 [Spirosoma sp.]|nr:hypothetical protein [Spirosoma sp.]
MILLDIPTFFGRLHPLVVHLPIGFLVLAALLDWASYWPTYKSVRAAVPLALGAGAASAVVACGLGWLLSTTGDYAPALLDNHKYSGLALAGVAVLLYALITPAVRAYVALPKKVFSGAFVAVLGLMSYAGHQGGNLTHGSDYLSLSVLTETQRPKPTSLEQVFVFEDVVQPMLTRRCGQCHQDGKLKGKLRMNTHADLLKGGKHGPAIVAGNLTKSELYRRVTLDPAHKEFMPTDGKTALTRNEVALLKWWIEKAAAADNTKLTAVKGSEAVQPMVAGLLGLSGSTDAVVQEAGNDAHPPNPAIPMTGDTARITAARSQGFVIRIMNHKPLMLDVTWPKKTGQPVVDLAVLTPLAKHIIWLNLSDLNLTDSQLKAVTQYSNLEKLRVEKNPISNEFLRSIAGLSYLQALNVYGTHITSAGLTALKDMKRLEKIYAWQTTITASDVQRVFKDSSNVEVIL